MTASYRGVDKFNWLEIIERGSSVKVGKSTLEQNHGCKTDILCIFCTVYCSNMLLLVK